MIADQMSSRNDDNFACELRLRGDEGHASPERKVVCQPAVAFLHMGRCLMSSAVPPCGS